MLVVRFLKEAISVLTCQRKKSENKTLDQPKKVTDNDLQAMPSIGNYKEEIEAELNNKIIEQKRAVKKMNQKLKGESKNKLEAFITNKPLITQVAVPVTIELADINYDALKNAGEWKKLKENDKKNINKNLYKNRKYLDNLNSSNMTKIVEQEVIIGGIWPLGNIFYKINNKVDKGLIVLINKAIENFHTFTPLRWVKDDTRDYYVEFVQNDKLNPSAQIGCLKAKGSKRKDNLQCITLPYPLYPETKDKLKVVCLMHEMCHCIGLFHEHGDADKKMAVKCSTKNISSLIEGIKFGESDNVSIMNYGHGTGKVYTKNKELRQLADNANFFSSSDAAIIKKQYGGKKGHHGEWHEPCSNNCNKIKFGTNTCTCDNCKQLYGAINCGYTGETGHWSCCMLEDEDSVCNFKHTGFWHAKCIGEKCGYGNCYCNNCGSRCTYKGNTNHWSCCGIEDVNGFCYVNCK